MWILGLKGLTLNIIANKQPRERQQPNKAVRKSSKAE